MSTDTPLNPYSGNSGGVPRVRKSMRLSLPQQQLHGRDSYRLSTVSSTSSEIPSDLSCSICMLLFIKPVMLSCGHSFCAECTRVWLQQNNACPTCRTETLAPIRNIALEQIVDEHKRLFGSISSHGSMAKGDQAFKRADGNRMSRRMVLGARGKIGDSYEMSLSPMPRGPGLLKTHSQKAFTNFSRQQQGRKSDTLMCRPVKLSLSNDIPVDEQPSSRLKRESFLRRSLGKLARKSMRMPRAQKEETEVINERAKAGSDEAPASIAPRPVSKEKKSLWKKLFGGGKHKNKHAVINEQEERSGAQFAGYEWVEGSDAGGGGGSGWRRQGRGREVLIAIAGGKRVGKTHLISVVRELCEYEEGARVVEWTERQRMAGCDEEPSRRPPNMTSIVYEFDGERLLIDLADVDSEEDHPCGLVGSADALLLLFSPSDPASLLSILTTHRRVAAQRMMSEVCVWMVSNVRVGGTSSDERTVRDAARHMGAVLVEINVREEKERVEQLLRETTESVLRSRRLRSQEMEVAPRQQCHVM